jgi:hypothetical protein
MHFVPADLKPVVPHPVKEELQMRRFLVIIGLCLSLLLPGAAALADGNSRGYIPAPDGTLAILIYYQYITAQNYWVNGHKVTDNLGFSSNIGILRPVYWLEWGPFIINPQFLLPFGEVRLNGDFGTLASSGVGDLTLCATFWFLHNDKTKSYVGFNPYFFIPIGTYNREKGGINRGGNVWRFREELGMVQGFQVIPGHYLYLELTLGGDFVTDNHNFLNPGVGHGQPLFGKLSQGPIFNLESHISYDITKSLFVAVDYYGHFGGKQQFNGFDVAVEGNPTNTSSLGVTLAFVLAPGYQLMLQYRSDVAVKNGPQQNILLSRFLWATDVGALLRK